MRACENGDIPSGAHICVICNIPVHIFEQCSASIPGEEEGYGQRRICKTCNSRDPVTIDETLSQRETEKWRGLDNAEKSVRRTKKSLYMRNDFLETDFEFPVKVVGETKGKKAILKNANTLGSKCHKINGISYSLQNTCAFDSITQIFLKAVTNPALQRAVHSWKTDFGDFINKLHNSGKLYHLELFTDFNT